MFGLPVMTHNILYTEARRGFVMCPVHHKQHKIHDIYFYVTAMVRLFTRGFTLQGNLKTETKFNVFRVHVT